MTSKVPKNKSLENNAAENSFDSIAKIGTGARTSIPPQPGSGAAFEELARVYKERDHPAIEWKKQGGQVIGCLGSDVPEEILIAAGFLPVRICGDPVTGIESADQYLEQGFDPFVRAQFSRIINGSYNYLDHLIISNSSDALIRVFYYLRALKQTEPDRPIPDLYFFDFLHSRFRMSALYDRDRTRDLQQLVEKWRGQAITAEELENAIALCNDNRQLLDKLNDLRGPQISYVSGSQALQVSGASLFLPRQQHTRLLQAFLEEATHFAPLPGKRIFLTGSPHDHTEFYDLVEASGGLIVGEDHLLSAGFLSGQIDPAIDPVDAIVDRYHLRPPNSSQATISERVTGLLEQVGRTGAQGVIFYIHTADDAPSWDFPEQRKALESLGLPVLRLDRQPYSLSDKAEVGKKISEFLDSIQTTERSSEILARSIRGG